MEIQKDFKELLELFNNNKVQFQEFHGKKPTKAMLKENMEMSLYFISDVTNIFRTKEPLEEKEI